MDLKQISLFLLDMDGTFYFEDSLIDGAKEFINKLIKQNKAYVFLTNNSSVNKNNYLDKMKRLDIPCDEGNIFSSGMATGIFLKENRPNKSVYVVGTKALKEELENYGVQVVDNRPDIVLVGFDRELCYEKLEKACGFIDDGAEFIATNADVLYPIKNHRYIPDCASICTMITNATKKQPLFIGKPNRYMVDMMAKTHQVTNSQIAMVGDRLYTDIAAGKNAEAVTVLVLTGETTKEMLEESTIKPDYVFSSIKTLGDEL
ncbi:MAG: HAD-IIA family hydrolase [Bacilli bacterium]